MASFPLSPPGIHQLQAFQNKVEAQVRRQDPVLADLLIAVSQAIITSSKTPRPNQSAAAGRWSCCARSPFHALSGDSAIATQSVLWRSSRRLAPFSRRLEIHLLRSPLSPGVRVRPRLVWPSPVSYFRAMPLPSLPP